jgi:hypothetical protein
VVFCLKNLFSSLIRAKTAPKAASIGVIRVDTLVRAMRKHQANPEVPLPPALA